jgi:hypothetical protein
MARIHGAQDIGGFSLATPPLARFSSSPQWAARPIRAILNAMKWRVSNGYRFCERKGNHRLKGTGTEWGQAELSHVMSTDDSESEKDKAWANVCRAEGWVCRVCGSVPERGQRFQDNLCDRLSHDRSGRVVSRRVVSEMACAISTVTRLAGRRQSPTSNPWFESARQIGIGVLAQALGRPSSRANPAASARSTLPAVFAIHPRS